MPDGTAYEDWDLLLGLAAQDLAASWCRASSLHYRQHGGGRRNRGAQRDLRRHYGTLRARHAALFARERELRARYPLPWRTRLAYRAQLRAGLLLPAGLVPRLLALKLRLRPRSAADAAHGQPKRSNQRARARMILAVASGIVRSTARSAQRGGRTTTRL